MTSIRVLLTVLVPLSVALPADDAKKAAGDLAKQVRRSVETGKEDEAIARLKELAEVRTPESLKMLFDLGVAIQLPKVYKAVSELLSGMTDEASLKFFEEEAKTRKDEPRVVFLADVLGGMKHEKAPEILGLLIEDKRDPILRSTIAALAKQKVRASVDPLLKLLERLETNRDHGLIYQELRDALFDLTFQDYDKMDDWKNWWEGHKASFDPTKKPEGVTQVRKASREKTADFAGHKIFAKNVVFVIDTSGSMNIVMKYGIPGVGGTSGGADRGGNVRPADEKGTKESGRLAKFWTRMEMARRALQKAIVEFDNKAKINIVDFNTHITSMEKTGLVPINSSRPKALDYVSKMKLKPDGNTNTMEALEKAFGIDRSVTEIYFLSDGEPSKDGQKVDPTEPILEKVEVMNRFRKVKIHTFGFDPLIVTEGVDYPGLVKANNFLKKLAKSTGGTFTMLKVTDDKPPKDFH